MSQFDINAAIDGYRQGRVQRKDLRRAIRRHVAPQLFSKAYFLIALSLGAIGYGAYSASQLNWYGFGQCVVVLVICVFMGHNALRKLVDACMSEVDSGRDLSGASG